MFAHRQKQQKKDSRLSRTLSLAASLLGSTFLAGNAVAQTTRISPLSMAGLDPANIVSFAIAAGLTVFSVAAASALVFERRKGQRQQAALLAEIAALKEAEDRIQLILGVEKQLIVSWSGRAEPHFEGDPSVAGAGTSVKRALAFGSWVAATDVAKLEAALEALKQRGTGFRLILRRLNGGFVEALGATCAGQAVLRLKDIGDERSDFLRVQSELNDIQCDLDAVIGLLDSLAHPVWFRDAKDVLIWTNKAFLDAVEADTLVEARERSLELLDRMAREESARRRTAGEAYEARVAAVVAGKRRIVDVVERLTPGGSAGIAIDVTDLEAMRSDLRRQTEAHGQTLDQLPTAVAIFDKTQKLSFYNAAYKSLWGISASLLDSHPTDGEILENLRTDRKLPEQADFRTWKAEVLSAYHAVEPREMWWHLPDRRTLRVVANPNPQGGLTYLFDDVSDRFQLETDFNALVRVQGETLDTLREGVAVFGQDGKLRLSNHAFAEMWNLSHERLAEHPHIDVVIGKCRELAPESAAWVDIRAAVASLPETRLGTTCRIERTDEVSIECMAQPLPDGATLLTFSDITASEKFAKALTERNAALERASNLRDLFVYDVSYELRSPLTNIVGFTQMLGSETIGPLNEKQREYSGHIERSSEALLALLNDILDLAGLDAGSLQLVPENVDIREAIETAVRGIEDRIAEAGLRLEFDVPDDIGAFTADGKRIRQILFHMLSGAVGASAAQQAIRISARRENEQIALSVADEGQGVSASIRARIFEGQESNSYDGGGHRGVGLQLAIVRQLVELHGGHIQLQTTAGNGAIMTCFFPTNLTGDVS
ncbi:PAS-domain containing protein [Microvirga sp. W0021]|uniref:histidine kinase n=1 Tax=Hohaiivirga grylli TaxID=3133970 RepID=A0ABV0BG32_9HYPH